MSDLTYKSKSKSDSDSSKMAKLAHKILGISKTASIDEINAAYKTKLLEIQSKYADKPDKLVTEADNLYAAYRSAYLAKDGANEDQMLPLTIEGPDSMLNAFGLQDLTEKHTNIQVRMQSQAHYKDGQLVKKESNKTETFINRDGKRESKIFENGKLIRHTIDGKDVLNMKN